MMNDIGTIYAFDLLRALLGYQLLPLVVSRRQNFKTTNLS